MRWELLRWTQGLNIDVLERDVCACAHVACIHPDSGIQEARSAHSNSIEYPWRAQETTRKMDWARLRRCGRFFIQNNTRRTVIVIVLEARNARESGNCNFDTLDGQLFFSLIKESARRMREMMPVSHFTDREGRDNFHPHTDQPSSF